MSETYEEAVNNHARLSRLQRMRPDLAFLFNPTKKRLRAEMLELRDPSEDPYAIMAYSSLPPDEQDAPS